MSTEEFEIEWIPEDTGAPYQEFDLFIDLTSEQVDKLCKNKYGHTNWARMGAVTPDDLLKNPAYIDYNEGIVYFKNSTNV
jgi:hypothetical protein